MSEFSVVQNLVRGNLKLPLFSGGWKKPQYKLEVNTGSNWVDVVYFRARYRKLDSVVAVEVKVRDWRGALRQAYRNKLFADQAYVALPAKNSGPALSNIVQFRRANVGLIAVYEKYAEDLYEPRTNNFRSPQH